MSQVLELTMMESPLSPKVTAPVKDGLPSRSATFAERAESWMELAGRTTPPPETVRPPLDWRDVARTFCKRVVVPVEPETVRYEAVRPPVVRPLEMVEEPAPKTVMVPEAETFPRTETLKVPAP